VQTGQIFKRRGHWHLKFYRTDMVNGQPKRVRTTRRLAPVSDLYRSKKDVRPLATDILDPLNRGSVNPESGLSFAEFTEQQFLPHVKAKRKPSTAKFYRVLFENHLKDRVGKIRMRDFSTRHAQEVLDALDSTELTHQTLLRIKTTMSAIFTYARQREVIRHANPVQGCKAEGKRSQAERYAYSLDEVSKMLTALPEPARTSCAVAAFTGLRAGEIRGLRWEDYTGEELNVRRSVWETFVGEAKTERSEGAVPVIPVLREMLDDHKKRSPRKGGVDYIFAGEKMGFALQLDNLTRRTIMPALGEKWHGWHAFRRGLATNLYGLRVPPKVIQKILRHAAVETTNRHYVIIDAAESEAAMKRLTREMKRKGLKWGQGSKRGPAKPAKSRK
jgi:integrase